jgi:tetratricopeptide (TPR) repeat protein
MKRRINPRLLLITLAGLVVLGVGLHLLHGYQVRRNAAAFLREADRHEQEGDDAKAIEDLARYLGLRPDDDGAYARYALLLDKLAKTPRARERAYLVLEQALRRNPERADIRLRLVRTAMSPQLQRFADAQAHLDILLTANPKDAELLDLLGQCEEFRADYENAGNHYRESYAAAPDRIESYLRHANLLRHRLNRPGDADAVLEEMLLANPRSFQALLARSKDLIARGQGDVKRWYSSTAEAARYVIKARELAPDEAEVILAWANLALRHNRLGEARAELERGIALHEKDFRLRVQLARVELQSGPERRQEAVRRLHEARQLLPEDLDALWALAELLLDAGERTEADELLTRFENHGAGQAPVDYLRARARMQEGKFADAVLLLERSRPALVKVPQLGVQADYLIGVCYAQLNNHDRHLEAMNRVLAVDPSNVPAAQSRASALLALGRVDEALLEFQRLLPRAPQARLTVARLLLARNLRRPPLRRDWGELEALLRDAPDDLRRTVDFDLFEIDFLLAQGKEEPANAKAKAARDAHPKEARCWVALAFLAERKEKGDPEKARAALGVLDEARKEIGDCAELRLARATRLLYGRKSGPEAAAVLRELEPGTDAWPRANQVLLLRGLAELQTRFGEAGDAYRLWKRVAEAQPGDMGVRLVLFDLAVNANDRAETERLLRELREIEGPEGVLWRYGDAVRLIEASRREGNREWLPAARVRIGEVSARRPGWGRVPLALGAIEEVEGNIDAAIEKYTEAVWSGERQAQVVRHTVELLARRRRFKEARELLHAVHERNGLTGDLSRLNAEVLLTEKSGRDQALDLAKQAVSTDSRDYRDHLWLGMVYWSSEGKAEAEKAFRKAVELNPTTPETWIPLVLLLAQTDRKAEAEAEMQKAQEKLKPEDMPLLLCAGYEALGKRDRAEEQYLALLKAKPNDHSLLAAAAQFYLRGGQTQQAEPMLRQLAQLRKADAEETAAWARRALALVLIVGGDYRKSEQALKLLDENAARRNDPEDERVRALVLAARPGERRRAIRILEDSFARLLPGAYERFLLARLYEADRQNDKADQTFQDLVHSEDGRDNTYFLSQYIYFLLRNGKTEDADRWLAGLEAREPQSIRAIELRARVLSAKGKGDQAARLIVGLADREFAARKDARLLGRAALVLEYMDRFEEADALFRRYVAEAGDKQPESMLEYAGFLARQQRLEDALKLLDEAAARCSPEQVARVGAAILRVCPGKEAEFRRVERRIQAARDAKPGSADLLLSLADLRDAEGRYDEAIGIYYEVLKIRPDDVMALNNLAWLLAFRRNDTANALPLLDQAFKVAGPAPGLLDTRGMIRARAGRHQEAADDLEEAIAQVPDGLRYFHLAQVYRMMGKGDESRKAWLRSCELKIKPYELHALERADYQAMKGEYGDKP